MIGWARHGLAAGLVVAISLAPATAATAQAPASPAFDDRVPPTDAAALDEAMAATCGRSVVLLGEASHGDGHADAFKSALVQRLVSRCGFRTLLFEASFQEFIPLQRAVRAHRPVTAADVGTAVGALWKFDDEIQPLLAFAASKASEGRLALGGLDFQVGTFQQPYGNDLLTVEILSGLPAPRRDECQALLHARIDGDDPPGGLSDEQSKAASRQCLREAAAAPGATGDAEERRASLQNLEAWLAADGRPVAERVRARDHMMVDNAIRAIDAAPAPPKVLVWLHNGHAARSTAGMADYGDADNFGAALARRYGDRLYALGITARAGTWRWTPGTDKPVPPRPPDALETRAVQAARSRTVSGATPAHAPGSVFLGGAALQALPACPAGFFGHADVTARWAASFDGVVVLDEEHPPHRTSH